MKGLTWILVLITSGLTNIFGADSPYFHTFKAKSGDGILVVLNRYELDEYDCNMEKFLELNQLSKNDFLLAGKEYKLPVLVYKYNGKSIRTTLGIDDYDTAKRIANYNRLVQNRSLRKTDYESSQVLWVPYHELNCPATIAKPIAIEVRDVEPSHATPVKNDLTSLF